MGVGLSEAFICHRPPPTRRGLVKLPPNFIPKVGAKLRGLGSRNPLIQNLLITILDWSPFFAQCKLTEIQMLMMITKLLGLKFT